MGILGTALIQAAIALIQFIIKQESPFITEEFLGLMKVAESALQAALSTDIPLDQKEILWNQAWDAVKAAGAKVQDEAASIPSSAGSEIFPILTGLMSVGFKSLIGSSPLA
jgi:hypothetical protein